VTVIHWLPNQLCLHAGGNYPPQCIKLAAPRPALEPLPTHGCPGGGFVSQFASGFVVKLFPADKTTYPQAGYW